jgi:hypothetical protein
MSKIKNKKVFDIALAVGGSHYPGVGGELLEKFAMAVIEECITVLDQDDGATHHTKLLKEHFGVE